MKVSIIYVNYNTSGLLLDSIRSLRELGTAFDYEIIVVDNASREFDAMAVRALAPKAKIIESKVNIGFGKGNNLGARQAEGDFLWILNTDTLVPADHQLGELIAFLDENADYGAALPMLRDDLGVVQPTQVAYFPTPAKLLLNIPVRLLCRLIPAFRGLGARVNYDYRAMVTNDVEVAVAAALFVRRSVFEAVGGFSPEFFMFYEDSDLCRKIWKAGMKIRFVAEARMTHLWGKSIQGNRSFARRKKLYFRSQDIYLRKWHSWLAWVVVWCLRWPLTIRYWVFNR